MPTSCHWAQAAPVKIALAAAASVTAVFVARRPSSVVPILCSAAVSFPLGTGAIQALTRHGLAGEFEAVGGGCAIAGYDIRSGRKVATSQDVRLSWIVGGNSERVHIIRDDGAFEWEYAKFGETRVRTLSVSERDGICAAAAK